MSSNTHRGFLAFGLALFVPGLGFAQNSVSTPPVPAIPPPYDANRIGAQARSRPAPVTHGVPDMVAPANRIHGAGPDSAAHSSSGPADATPFGGNPEALSHPMVR